MLEIKNLSKTFNKGTLNEKPALCGIDLALQDGDFVSVIGGNGAGKSTLLNAIAGVWQPDSGSIKLDGNELIGVPEHKRAKFLGRVFQDPMMGTAPDMMIEENLAIAHRRGSKRGLKWMMAPGEREDYKELLKILGLGLEDRIFAKTRLLSGGQRQALTLLMAAMKMPKLLLLDEHTAALDPQTATKVLSITEELIEENSLTSLMVTHNMKNAIRCGNRLIMMHEGRIILDIKGEEKKSLKVEDLLKRFADASGESFSDDRALLA